MSEPTYHPDLPAEPQRPRAVTVIGGIWLALAAISLFKTIVNFILWRALQPAIPSLVALAAQRDPRTRFLNRLFEHYGSVLAFQALLAAAIGISAYQLLRLRPWARVAVQAVCWLGLVYMTCFAAFWLAIWARSSGHPEASAPRLQGRVPVSVGVAVCVALAAGLAVMIGMLRSRRMRAAFISPSSSPPARYD